MTEDIKRLETKIEELAERLRRVENKVFSGADEARRHPPVPEQIEDREPVAPAAPRERIPATAILSFTGRSLVVLGGAFLLRWLTQSDILPQKIGSVIGMIYALLWIAMADFNAGRGQRHSAVFHGITGACIALPLLVEATTKFHFLTPTLSAILLTTFIILGLVVAGRRKLRSLAWIVTVPAIPLAFILASQTRTAPPFLISMLILGFVTLWLGYLRHWHVLATLVAAAANLSLSLMVIQLVRAGGRFPAGQQASLFEVLSMLFGLIVLYFGSYCFRVFKRKRTITPLEIGQTLSVLVIGLGGAAMVINSSGRSMFPLGILCLVLSVAAYTAAYGLLPRLRPDRRNFLFYTLIALVMVLIGCELSLGRSASVLVFSAIALIAGLLANRISSPILFLHGAVYLTVAIFRSGLTAATLHGYAGSSAQSGEWISVLVLSVLVLTTLYPWFPKPRGRSIDMTLGRRSVDFFLFVTVFALGGFLISLLTQLGPQGEDTETYRRFLTCTRTGVLALSAAFVAWRSNRTRFGSLAWLAYTILFVGAIKIVFEDISVGGAVTLFLSFGLYGGTLILVPRLLHKTAKQKPGENEK
jgi:hypothetical protein